MRSAEAPMFVQPRAKQAEGGLMATNSSSQGADKFKPYLQSEIHHYKQSMKWIVAFTTKLRNWQHSLNVKINDIKMKT